MFAVVAPWVELCIVFKPIFKLACLSKLKDQLATKAKSHLVYKVNCTQCKDFYIGMTCRRLEDRLSEHASSDASALFRHTAETGHVIGYDVPEILAMDNIKSRLLVKETLKIHELHAIKSLNRNVGSFELKLW